MTMDSLVISVFTSDFSISYLKGIDTKNITFRANSDIKYEK